MNSALAAVVQQLNLQADPVVRMRYVHRTGEELICGAVLPPYQCPHCLGKGRVPPQLTAQLSVSSIRCQVCRGEGRMSGNVVCYQPDPDLPRTLKLTWGFHEFLENFRRAAGAQVTPDMFE